MRYLVLNCLVLLVVLGLVWRQRSWLFHKRWLYGLGFMLLLTLVFDSFIVGYGIVAYNPDHFLGILLGRAPIEDFGYTIAAFMVVPYLWRIFEKK